MKHPFKKLAVLSIPCVALLAMAAINPKIIKSNVLAEDTVIAVGYTDPIESVKLRNSGDDPASGEFKVYYTEEDGTKVNLQEPISVIAEQGSPHLWNFPAGKPAGIYNCTAEWAVDPDNPLKENFKVTVAKLKELTVTCADDEDNTLTIAAPTDGSPQADIPTLYVPYTEDDQGNSTTSVNLSAVPFPEDEFPEEYPDWTLLDADGNPINELDGSSENVPNIDGQNAPSETCILPAPGEYTIKAECGNELKIIIVVVQFDLDTDSDNNNNIGTPDGNPYEDSIEDNTESYGKFILVNHNDDDKDGVPDYADLDNDKESQFYPIELEIRPDLDWDTTKVALVYDGSNELPGDAAFEGDDIGNGYRDFDSPVKSGKGALRIWFNCSPTSSRSSVNYVRPGHQYQASQLGFSDSCTTVTFYVEGLNSLEKGRIRAVLYPTGSGSLHDEVVYTTVAPSIDINCSNGRSTDPGDGLRVGVPDVDFEIDGDDDMIEDQKDGMHFWPSRDYHMEGGQMVSSGITPLGATDLLPFTVNIPASLLEAGFEFHLQHMGGMDVFIAKNYSETGNIQYLTQEQTLNQQVSASETQVASPSLLFNHTTPLPDPTSGVNRYVLKTRSGNPMYVRLWVKEPGEALIGHKSIADQVKLCVKDVKEYYTMFSLRGQTGTLSDYTLSEYSSSASVETQKSEFYGPATKISGPDPDTTNKTQYMVLIHGYNVGSNAAYGEFGEDYKRTFWTGYRGNVIGLSWRGSENFYYGDYAKILPRPYADNVANAFRTASAVRDFLRDTVRGTYGASVENTYVIAHSLGTQLAMDAMRLYQHSNPGETLARTLTLMEAAFWSEMCWEPSERNGRSIEELEKESWCFYFNDGQASSRDSVTNLVHSYNRDDFALWVMIVDDYFIRNKGLHNDANRPRPNCFRVATPLQGTPAASFATTDSRNLAHQIPAMLTPTGAGSDTYTMRDFVPVQGQEAMSDVSGVTNIRAADWYHHNSHNGHKGGSDGEIDDDDMAGFARDDVTFWEYIGYASEEFDTPLAQIWGWFGELIKRKAYTKGIE